MVRQRIAVIGSGVSGLSAAWLLSEKYEVTVYEASTTLGGHCHTITAQVHDESVTIDTGFMVYNETGYPELTKFFNYLQIATKPAGMSFSVSLDDGKDEWATADLNGIFADRWNLIKPSYYSFLFEILRFFRVSNRILRLAAGNDDFSQSTEDFLNTYNFSRAFRKRFLYPMCSLIWSAPERVIKQFPVRMIQEFLQIHHLLTAFPNVTWRSVVGGSTSYIERVADIIASHGGVIKRNTPVLRVDRSDTEVVVHTKDSSETFDYVIFGTHAYQTLRLLVQPTETERELLSQFTYQHNQVISHSDTSLMPKRKAAWAAWNYCDVIKGERDDEMSLTYNMNILNDIPENLPVFVTINPTVTIDPEFVHGTFMYSHPLKNAASHRAQQQLHRLQGQKRSYFCGSYFGYGFHEDGFCSGETVANLLGVSVPWRVEK